MYEKLSERAQRESLAKHCIDVLIMQVKRRRSSTIYELRLALNHEKDDDFISSIAFELDTCRWALLWLSQPDRFMSASYKDLLTDRVIYDIPSDELRQYMDERFNWIGRWSRFAPLYDLSLSEFVAQQIFANPVEPDDPKDP